MQAPQDLLGNGRSEVVFANSQGGLSTWQLNNQAVEGGGPLGDPGALWTYEGTGDFYGNGASDVLWLNQDGALWEQQVIGNSLVGGSDIGNPSGSWVIAGIADFSGVAGPTVQVGNLPNVLTVGDFVGEGEADILYEQSNGMYAKEQTNGSVVGGGGNIWYPGSSWAFQGIGDFNGDGTSDLLFENASGVYEVWSRLGTTLMHATAIGNLGSS